MTTAPPRPKWLAPALDAIPSELTDITRWVLWCGELRPNEKTGELKWTKIPYTADKSAAAVDDADTWCAFSTAREAYEAGDFDGVGLVLAGDGLVGVDFDHARDAATGAINPLVLADVRRLASYTEISPSGTGLRVFVKGSLPGGKGRNWRPIGTEIYDRGRYLTVTGLALPGGAA